jgi:hypothetical protein
VHISAVFCVRPWKLPSHVRSIFHVSLEIVGSQEHGFLRASLEIVRAHVQNFACVLGNYGCSVAHNIECVP